MALLTAFAATLAARESISLNSWVMTSLVGGAEGGGAAGVTSASVGLVSTGGEGKGLVAEAPTAGLILVRRVGVGRLGGKKGLLEVGVPFFSAGVDFAGDVIVEPAGLWERWGIMCEKGQKRVMVGTN